MKIWSESLKNVLKMDDRPRLSRLLWPSTTYSAVEQTLMCVSMNLSCVCLYQKRESHYKMNAYVTETQPKSSLHRWWKINRECVRVCVCTLCEFKCGLPTIDFPPSSCFAYWTSTVSFVIAEQTFMHVFVYVLLSPLQSHSNTQRHT